MHLTDFFTDVCAVSGSNPGSYYALFTVSPLMSNHFFISYFHDFERSDEYWSSILLCEPQLGSDSCFPVIDLQGEEHRAEVPVHHLPSGGSGQLYCILVCQPRAPGSGGVPRFLHSKLLFFFPDSTVLFGRDSVGPGYTQGEGGEVPPSKGGAFYIRLCGILL